MQILAGKIKSHMSERCPPAAPRRSSQVRSTSGRPEFDVIEIRIKEGDSYWPQRSAEPHVTQRSAETQRSTVTQRSAAQRSAAQPSDKPRRRSANSNSVIGNDIQ